MLKLDKINHFLVMILATSFLLSSCAGKSLSLREMAEQTQNLKLPYAVKDKKALVYFIYRIDVPAVYLDRVELFYTKSNVSRFKKANSSASTILNALTFGIAEDKPLSKSGKLGYLYPGRFKAHYFEPGYYEINRFIEKPTRNHDQDYLMQIKLEAGKAYFVILKGDNFYNRYSNQVRHNIYMSREKNLVKAKYMLSKNFKDWTKK